VSERDAFGREIGEDAPGAPSRPAPAPGAAAPASPSGGGPSSGARTAVSVVVALLMVAGITGLVIVGLGGGETGATIESAGTFRQAPAVAQGPGSPAYDPGAPRSFIHRRALASALRELHRRGRLRLVRVAPDRVDAQLVTRAGGLRNVQVAADGAVRDLGTAGSAAGGLPAIPFAQVDAAAPARIVREAARRAGRRPSRVDYLVLLMLPTGQSWNVYFKPDGLHFMADRHGAGLRRR
jgi:hypothetical protein